MPPLLHRQVGPSVKSLNSYLWMMWRIVASVAHLVPHAACPATGLRLICLAGPSEGLGLACASKGAGGGWRAPSKARVASFGQVAFNDPSGDDRPGFIWGGAMMFRTTELKQNVCGLMDAWTDGGYSEDFATHSLARYHGRTVCVPKAALFPSELGEVRRPSPLSAPPLAPPPSVHLAHMYSPLPA